MSEQVKRYRFLIDGSHKGVVLAADFDTLAQRCRELEAQLESARQATNSECMDWARGYERRKEAQAERDTLRAEVADQKAALLEAERGNEEMVRLRAEKRGMEKDSARIDWLASQARMIYGHKGDASYQLSELPELIQSTREECLPDDLRRAIDACMEASK